MDRPVKRQRTVSADIDDPYDSSIPPSDSSNVAATRPRRAAAAPATTIERASPDDPAKGIRLTVKASPSKLREATSGANIQLVPPGTRPKYPSRQTELMSGPRGSRNRNINYNLHPSSGSGSDSDEDEDEEEEEEQPELYDEDAEGEPDEEEDEDAEGEEDIEMTDVPPPSAAPPKSRAQAQPPKPTVTVTQPDGELPSVEDKEMAMGDEDDELSDLDSQEGGEADAVGEEDAEGEDDLDDDEEGDEDDEDDDVTPSLSRGGTPDLSKLTRRQRAAYAEEGELMALSNEAQKKKHLTAEEHAMRRAEMARRRKNLSEKRNEEEKMDTINRLLKKQAPKRRTRKEIIAAEEGEDGSPEVERANPVYTRYIQSAAGTKLAIPDEQLALGGGLFDAAIAGRKRDRPFAFKMVEEIDSGIEA